MTQADVAVAAPGAVTQPIGSGPSNQENLPLQYAVVKTVLSGDCVVIRPLTPSGIMPERTLAFSNITAPRLEKRPNQGLAPEYRDGPYAWEAREFVRQRTVGQHVAYTVENTVNSRDYGTMFLGKTRDSTNLTHLLISEGLVEVRRPNNINRVPGMAELCALEDKAKSDLKGKWNEETLNDHIRRVAWAPPEPLRQFVDRRKGVVTSAIVEHVRDGSTIRVVTIPDNTYMMMAFSGINTITMPFADQDTPGDEPDPLAVAAKNFVEQRLLQREVNIVIEGLSGNMILGSVLHPTKGNIAPYLLEEGLAKTVNWSMSNVTKGREEYWAAEQRAKVAQRGMWKDAVAPAGAGQQGGGNVTFSAVVIEINTAEIITVMKDDEEKRIKFSSVRGPRLEGENQAPRGKNFRPLYQIPCMFDAREFLRQRLIGERVNIAVDYVQPANESFPESTCCTVTVNGQNIAEALILKGLATTLRHRRDDNDRSRHYQDLMDAEAKAIKDRVGIHDPNKAPIKVADICGDIKLARNFETSLKKGLVSATVDYVVSCSRFRLYVKSATCVLSFLLAGINTPKPERNIGNKPQAADPFGEEARLFARRILLQRDVQIKVEAMDRVGNFIGFLYVKDGRKNFNTSLLQNGYGWIHQTLSDRHEHYNEMLKAQTEARANNLNLWSIEGAHNEPAAVIQTNEDEDQGFDATAGDDPAPTPSASSGMVPVMPERRINTKEAVCTEIGENLRFYVQHVEDGKQVECLMTNLQANVANLVPSSLAVIKVGDLVAAKFSLDGQWYRAKVEKKATAGDTTQFSVYYLDYGNRETVTGADVCQLPNEFGLSQFRAHCHEYILAFSKLPGSNDLKADCMSALAQRLQQTPSGKFLINPEYKLGGVEAVSVFVESSEAEAVPEVVAAVAETSESAGGSSDESAQPTPAPKPRSNVPAGHVDLALSMIRNGQLLADRPRREAKFSELCRQYAEAEKEAKRTRKNMWCYGDITEDPTSQF